MKWKTALLAAGSLFAGINAFLGNRQLIVEKEVMYSRKLPAAFEGMKVMLISDLHRKKFGKDYGILLDSVKAASPDIIIFAGDLYSKNEEELGGKVKLMKDLDAIAPVYYAPGNHELHRIEVWDAMYHKLKSAGINVLRNEMAVVCRGSDRINIYGIQIPLKYFINKDGTYCSLPVPDSSTISRYLGESDPDHCDLLIGHNPLFFEAYERWGADFVFSGHVHGGVIRLPIAGGILSPERRFFPKYTKGIYRLGKTVMAVSSGLGKFRINNPSQMMLLTLTGKKQPSKHSKGHAWDI